MDGRSHAGRRRRVKKKRCGEMSSAFWLFSRSVYATAGVQEECLLLQDKFGVDVNLLLFSAFVGAVHGALLPTEELSDASAAVAQWQEGVVRSLRTIRRAIKQTEPPHPIVAAPVQACAEVSSLSSLKLSGSNKWLWKPGVNRASSRGRARNGAPR